jgi:hypothetical protein
MKSLKVLIVEDEIKLANLIKASFEFCIRFRITWINSFFIPNISIFSSIKVSITIFSSSIILDKIFKVSSITDFAEKIFLFFCGLKKFLKFHLVCDIRNIVFLLSLYNFSNSFLFCFSKAFLRLNRHKFSSVNGCLH